MKYIDKRAKTMDIFRVMQFSKLVRIAETSTLAFVSYRKFSEDPHEGSLIRALTTSDGVEDVYRALKRDSHPMFLLLLISGARSANRTVFMQSWTKKAEHNLMWRHYAIETDDAGRQTSKNAVRVRMTEAGRKNLPRIIFAVDARYEPEFDILKEIDLVYRNGFIDFQHSLRFKLDAYQHEDEVRLMTPIYNDIVSPLSQSAPLPPWWHNPNGDEDVTLIPLESLKDVFHSVMAGPEADDQFQNKVERFCKLHGVLYEGKSMLQTPRYTGSSKIFTSDPG